ncbi:MAG: hypothetical protein QOI41_1395, partial [Myxococcales bacterium]|nr:hypothetical protein [Myxococcales bacterium]
LGCAGVGVVEDGVVGADSAFGGGAGGGGG